jgi:Zn-dependent M28 family amino/carboxypeptidase
MNSFLILITYIIITQMTTAVMHSSADSRTLKEHVEYLCDFDRARSTSHPEYLDSAALYLEEQLSNYPLEVQRQEYEMPFGRVRNLIASFGPENGPRIIVGAHYDVAGEQPGADDNASGVAGLLELARLLSEHPGRLSKRIDLVAYTLEEPPYFGTEQMGSYIHAKSLNDQKAEIELMISLEMIGCFSDEPGSQAYPIGLMKLFYPTKGNFIAVVSNLRSGRAAGRFAGMMKKKCNIPIKRLAAPTFVTGVDFSDHRNYWHFGYKAIMITDTAFLRNKNYHEKTDTPETLDYVKMAEVVNGVYFAITQM